MRTNEGPDRAPSFALITFNSRLTPPKIPGIHVRLTTFTDYSLRVLIYLAADPGQRATIAEIAQAFDISENHLMKVVHLLGKSGVLLNIRGKGGGLELGKPPAAINVGKLVRSTEGAPMPAECFDAANNRCII